MKKANVYNQQSGVMRKRTKRPHREGVNYGKSKNHRTEKINGCEKETDNSKKNDNNHEKETSNIKQENHSEKNHDFRKEVEAVRRTATALKRKTAGKNDI